MIAEKCFIKVFLNNKQSSVSLNTDAKIFVMSGNPAGNYMSKVNNSNARTKCSKLYFTPCSSVFIVKFVQINTGWELPGAEK